MGDLYFDPAAFDPEHGPKEESSAPALGFLRFQAAVERAHQHPECPAPDPSDDRVIVVSVVGTDGVATVQEIRYPMPFGCVLRELDRDTQVIAQVVAVTHDKKAA